MITIEPLPLLLGQHLSGDGTGVDGTKGDGFKIEEGAKLLSAGMFLCDDQVLDADAILAGTVESRFVRGDHSRFQHRGVLLQSYVLRTLMHVEEMTDTVTGAVPVGELVFPQGFPSQDVEL